MLRERLKSATAASHAEVEALAAQLGVTTTREGFIRHCQVLQAFFSQLEREATPHIGSEEARAFAQAHALEQDLMRNQSHVIDEPPPIGLCCRASALGAMYVSEGSRLGAQFITRRLRDNRVDVRTFDTTQISKTDERTRWSRFISVLEHLPETFHAQAEQGARASFENLSALYRLQDRSFPSRFAS